MGRDLLLGELLPGRNLLDPGLLCQAAYRSEAPSWCSGSRSSSRGRATHGRAAGSPGWPAKFLGSPEWPGSDRSSRCDFSISSFSSRFCALSSSSLSHLLSAPCHKLRFVPSAMQATCQYLCSPPFFVSFFSQNTLISHPSWPGLPGRRPQTVLLLASTAARPGFLLAPLGLLASLPRAIRPPLAPIFLCQIC